MILEGTLAEQTEKKILEYIVNNSFKIGEGLPTEDEFTELLGVSRVVVREALSRLRMLGIVETKRKRGTILKSPDFFGGMRTIIDSGTLEKETLKDLFELRLMLEIGMADFIFDRKTDDDIKLLREIVEREKNTHSVEESIRLDIKFHSTLYKISGNKSLKKFQQILESLFAIYTPREKNWKANSYFNHMELLEILCSGTPEVFRTVMRLHLNPQFKSMRKIFKEKEE